MLDSSKRQRLQQAGHVFAGLIILLKSSAVSEHHPVLGAVLVALGLVFIVVAVFHHHAEALLRIQGERILFLLEAAALSVVAYEMVAEHKHYLQYAYAFAALVYVFVAIFFTRLRKPANS